jgi:quinoprotein glucose dehydrogenase
MLRGLFAKDSSPVTIRLAIVLLLLPASLHTQGRTVDWPVYNGSTAHSHYSTLDQITPHNVSRLRVAWTYETRDEFPGSEMQANPVVIDGVLYATTPKLRVVALDAATGRERWSFDPNAIDPQPGLQRNRGVVVYRDRVFVTQRHNLWALDRRTGTPIATFGTNGRVDLREGLSRPVEGLSVGATTPGVVFDGLLILGTAVPEALPSAPGDIRAYDATTGAIRWTFHTIPHPGEPGYDTWPKDAWKTVGGVNAWSGVTVDSGLGIVFAATGSAAFDFYGANRAGDDLFANCVLALDAHTGAYLWHFQTVKHDLWDMDLPAPPALVTIVRGGHRVPAIAQITKTGYVYLFERRTGRPLFPIASRPVPSSTLEGEVTSPTQPYPVKPPPFVRQRLTDSMLTTRTPEAHDTALAIFGRYGAAGMFRPPSQAGVIVFPGFDGGGEWGGPAFDPETGLLYVNANEMAWLLRMLPRENRSLYRSACASCHGDDMKGSATGPSLVGIAQRHTKAELTTLLAQGTGRMPGFAMALPRSVLDELVNFLLTGEDVTDSAATSPFFLQYRHDGYNMFLDPDGYPAISPPWGTLSAIDLNAGEIRWTIPFGEYPALARQGIHGTGTDNYGGAIVTRNGLLFIAATTYDRKFHVFDKRTGRLLWEAELPASGNATPALYMVNGKEYVVIACGGGKHGALSGGSIVAFALPDE